MVCDRKVLIVEDKKDEKGALVSYHRLEATQVRLDNPVQLTQASGLGRLYLLGLGTKDQGPAGPRPPAQPAEPAAQELQLTRIDFSGRMFSNNKNNVRTSKFYDNVEVYHAPADRPDMEFNPDRPPKGGFYMRCDMLTVYTKVVSKDKNAQVMRADRRVTFRTQEFFGHATVVKFDESQDLVYFEGPANNPARLYQFQGPGQAPKEINGTRILYNRRTGQFSLEGGSNIESRLAPELGPAASLLPPERI